MEAQKCRQKGRRDWPSQTPVGQNYHFDGFEWTEHLLTAHSSVLAFPDRKRPHLNINISPHFVQLQSCFAKHMLRLDEHRELGNSEASAERLATEHAEYSQAAMVKLILFRKIKEKLEKK